MDWKKYLPLAAIAGVALFLIARLSKGNSGPTQIINRGIDFTQNTSYPINRDAARSSTFGQLASVALGQQNITAKRDVALSQVEAEKIRADVAKQLGLASTSNQLSLGQLNAETQKVLAQINSNTALEQSRIAQAGRQFDADQQLKAIDLITSRQQASQSSQQNSNLLGQLIGALLRGSQQPSSRGSGGGGGSQSGVPQGTGRRTGYRIPVPRIGPFTPPFNPNYPAPVFNNDFGLPGINLPGITFDSGETFPSGYDPRYGYDPFVNGSGELTFIGPSTGEEGYIPLPPGYSGDTFPTGYNPASGSPYDPLGLPFPDFGGGGSFGFGGFGVDDISSYDYFGGYGGDFFAEVE